MDTMEIESLKREVSLLEQQLKVTNRRVPLCTKGIALNSSKQEEKIENEKLKASVELGKKWSFAWDKS